MYKSLGPILAALAAATAATAAHDLARQTHTFQLGMDVQGTLVSLTAVPSQNGDIVLQAGRLSAIPGTTAWFIGAEPDLAIILDLGGNTGQRGVKVTDVGHAAGNVHDVLAVPQYADFDFGFSVSKDGVVSHKFTATSNTFYACKQLLSQKENYYLSWGNPTSGAKPPTGCEATTLRQINA